MFTAACGHHDSLAFKHGWTWACTLTSAVVRSSFPPSKPSAASGVRIPFFQSMGSDKNHSYTMLKKLPRCAAHACCTDQFPKFD